MNIPEPENVDYLIGVALSKLHHYAGLSKSVCNEESVRVDRGLKVFALHYAAAKILETGEAGSHNAYVLLMQIAESVQNGGR